MKRTTLWGLSLLILLSIPGLAAAAEISAPISAQVPECGSDLGFLDAAPVTPAEGAGPLAGAVPAQSGCCAAKLRACQAGCACGVFEFNCDPATCQSSCICNICP